MDTVVLMSMFLGVFLGLMGWVWCLIVAGKVHLGWVVGMFLMSVIVCPWFAIKHWDRAKRPFIVWLIGSVLILGSMFMQHIK
jgi:hypothetical protein